MHKQYLILIFIFAVRIACGEYRDYGSSIRFPTDDATDPNYDPQIVIARENSNLGGPRLYANRFATPSLCDCYSEPSDYHKFQNAPLGTCTPGNNTDSHSRNYCKPRQISEVHEDGRTVVVNLNGKFELNSGYYETQGAQIAGFSTWPKNCLVYFAPREFQGDGTRVFRANVNYYKVRFSYFGLSDPSTRPSPEALLNWMNQKGCTSLNYLFAGHSEEFGTKTTVLPIYSGLDLGDTEVARVNAVYGGCNITRDPNWVIDEISRRMCTLVDSQRPLACPPPISVTGNQDFDPLTPGCNWTPMTISCQCQLTGESAKVTCTPSYQRCNAVNSNCTMAHFDNSLNWKCLGPANTSNSNKLFNQSCSKRSDSPLAYKWDAPILTSPLEIPTPKSYSCPITGSPSSLTSPSR